MIIGIHGKARHGKDTCAEHLVKTYGFTRYSFADPLKKALSILFNIDLNWFYDGELKNTIHPVWGVTPVNLLLSIGTEWGQYDVHKHLETYGAPKANWNRDIWVKRFLMVNETNPINYVIADIRFWHEIDRLKTVNSKLLKVVRINSDGSTYSEDYTQRKNHASERELDTYNDWDHIIKAKNTKELIQQLDKFIQSI